MKKYIKADIDYDWEYDSFSEAMEENYDQLLNIADDCNREAYDNPQMRVVIEIDKDGYIAQNWYPLMSNDESAEVVNGEDYVVMELSHGGTEEQADIEELALSNFYFSKTDKELDDYEQAAIRNGYENTDAYVEDKYSKQIEEEKSFVYDELAEEDIEQISYWLDDAIKNAKELGR